MIDDRRVLAIVPARAGSQRLPGKNVRLLAGRPLIAWTLETARAATCLDRALVSTDDRAVAAVARDMDFEVLDRPAPLAGHDASVIDAIAHAIDATGKTWDYVVLLQPTSPFRSASDIDGAVARCHSSGAEAVIGVSPLAKPRAFYGSLDAEDGFRLDDVVDVERVVINGAIYVGRPDRLLAIGGFQGPGTVGWRMPTDRGWDIDTPMDFAICQALALSDSGETVSGRLPEGRNTPLAE